MSAIPAYAVALVAAVPTTLAVLGLWIGHSRVVDGDSVDSVFLSYVFLFVTLIFAVASVANLAAVAIGQGAALVSPDIARPVTVAAAGALVVALTAWTQRGTLGAAPVSAVPIALFAGADMLILAGGLALLPSPLTTGA